MTLRPERQKILSTSTVRCLVLSAICAGMISCGSEEQENEGDASASPNSSSDTAGALATLMPASNSNVRGEVRFYPVEGALMIEVNATGLEPGSHGFHIHTVGDCSASDASSAGDHFAPNGNMHGAPQSLPEQHHAGDLGNIEATVTGVAQYQRSSSALSLSGPNSVIGKAVIIHAEKDDLETQPSGNSGARVACGVIGPVTELPESDLRTQGI